MSNIYESLNGKQREAVFCTEGPLLILAGAGSGKTRVLTHRIAYLIAEKKVEPWNICAITFTNKAAGEMRQRVDALVGYGSESIWVATFHSSCARILRRFADRLGYDNNFTIYDSDDSKSVMKEVCKKLQIDTSRLKEKAILNAISNAKNELINEREYADRAYDFMEQKISAAYTEYQDTPPDFVPAIREGKYENLVICRTFSKIYGLVGLRIGFAVAVPEFIAALEKVREPFNTSLLAQLAAAAALDDDEYLDKIRKMNKEGQQYQQKELKAMNVEFVP